MWNWWFQAHLIDFIFFFYLFGFFGGTTDTPLKLSPSNSRRWFGAGGGQVGVWWSKLHKHHKNLAIFFKINCKLGYIPFHRVTHISIVMLANFHSPHSIKNSFFCDMKSLSPSFGINNGIYLRLHKKPEAEKSTDHPFWLKQ